LADASLDAATREILNQRLGEIPFELEQINLDEKAEQDAAAQALKDAARVAQE